MASSGSGEVISVGSAVAPDGLPTSPGRLHKSFSKRTGLGVIRLLATTMVTRSTVTTTSTSTRMG